jgi:tetratricopeptide (TPR) repeat protein
LHRAIETYGIPAQLVSHETPAGEPAPKRFQPLFIDRAELPASPDLGQEIENALRASRYLIIVCSPHAAQSKWVNREIEAFAELGRNDRVLALIVDGEPHSGDAQECFPAALKQMEPIAADARRQGDGRSNAKLKLLSGMLGVSFDALKQRDAQRQIRRLRLTVAVAFVLVLAFAGLAWYANQQREKAVAARLQAESVLEFLLYDLRDALEPVGRLDIIEKVEQRVEEYYRELGVDPNEPRTLQNRWGAAARAGDFARDRGDLDTALTEYRADLAIAERLVAADATNTEWQRDLSVSHNRVGAVLQAQGDPAGALTEYRAGLAIAERLAAADATNALWQSDLSVSHGKVGDVLQAQGDLAGALTEYRADLAIRERLVAADATNTEWQRDLSVSHNRVGDVLQAQGDLAGALTAYRAGLAIVERLAAADATNAVWQRDLSVSHDRVGGVLQAQGDLAGALTAYRVGLAIAERLAAADATNTGWQRDLSVGHNQVGYVLEAQGDLAGALTAYRAAVAIRERLAAADATNAVWQRDLSVSHERVGRVLEAQGDLGGALTAYRAGLAIRERLAAADATNTEWQRDLWIACWRVADALEGSGDPTADEWWQRAFDILAGMKRAGMYISPADEEYYEQLRQKLGR